MSETCAESTLSSPPSRGYTDDKWTGRSSFGRQHSPYAPRPTHPVSNNAQANETEHTAIDVLAPLHWARQSSFISDAPGQADRENVDLLIGMSSMPSMDHQAYQSWSNAVFNHNAGAQLLFDSARAQQYSSGVNSADPSAVDSFATTYGPQVAGFHDLDDDESEWRSSFPYAPTSDGNGLVDCSAAGPGLQYDMNANHCLIENGSPVEMWDPASSFEGSSTRFTIFSGSLPGSQHGLTGFLDVSPSRNLFGHQESIINCSGSGSAQGSSSLYPTWPLTHISDAPLPLLYRDAAETRMGRSRSEHTRKSSTSPLDAGYSSRRPASVQGSSSDDAMGYDGTSYLSLYCTSACPSPSGSAAVSNPRPGCCMRSSIPPATTPSALMQDVGAAHSLEESELYFAPGLASSSLSPTSLAEATFDDLRSVSLDTMNTSLVDTERLPVRAEQLSAAIRSLSETRDGSIIGAEPGSLPVSPLPSPTLARLQLELRNPGGKIRKGASRFSCSMPGCTATFTTRVNHEGHMASHFGIKRFCCESENCGRMFSRQSDMRRHRKVHGIPPRFSCAHCPKSFARKDTLIAHCRKQHPGGSG